MSALRAKQGQTRLAALAWVKHAMLGRAKQGQTRLASLAWVSPCFAPAYRKRGTVFLHAHGAFDGVAEVEFFVDVAGAVVEGGRRGLGDVMEHGGGGVEAEADPAGFLLGRFALDVLDFAAHDAVGFGVSVFVAGVGAPCYV